MIYLGNAFSIHMLKNERCGDFTNVQVTRISASETRRILRSNAYKSVFGHEESIEHLRRYLGLKIKCSRDMIKLDPGDVLIVATHSSKRLYEAGYKISPQWRFYLVELK